MYDFSVDAAIDTVPCLFEPPHFDAKVNHFSGAVTFSSARALSVPDRTGD